MARADLRAPEAAEGVADGPADAAPRGVTRDGPEGPAAVSDPAMSPVPGAAEAGALDAPGAPRPGGAAAGDRTVSVPAKGAVRGAVDGADGPWSSERVPDPLSGRSRSTGPLRGGHPGLRSDPRRRPSARWGDGPPRGAGRGGLWARLGAAAADPGWQSRLARAPVLRRLVRREGQAMMDLVAGFVHAQVLAALVELDLLAALRTPRDPAELAASHGIAPARMAALCQAGAALGLLRRRRDGRYRLAMRGAALSGVPGLPEMIRHHALFYSDLADPVALLRGSRPTELRRFWPYVGPADARSGDDPDTEGGAGLAGDPAGASAGEGPGATRPGSRAGASRAAGIARDAGIAREVGTAPGAAIDWNTGTAPPTGPAGIAREIGIARDAGSGQADRTARGAGIAGPGSARHRRAPAPPPARTPASGSGPGPAPEPAPEPMPEPMSGPIQGPISGQVSDAAAERYSRLMADSQRLVAEDTLRAVRFGRIGHLMDVGGGSGAFLAAALRRHPRLRATLLDLPAVAPAAEARFAGAGLGHRVRVVPGDFRSGQLPGGADAISLVRVLYDHDDETVSRLMAAAFAALPPGGRLIVSEPMSGGRRPERAGDVYFAFYCMAMGTGRVRSADEIAAAARRAGFARIRAPRPFRPFVTSVLTAVKPA